MEQRELWGRSRQALMALLPLVLLTLAIGNDSALAATEQQGGGSGLPQLDVRTYSGQIFWLLVSFVLLYRLMRTRGIPQIADIVERRQARISGDLDRAAQLRAEAEEAQKRYEQVLAEAQSSAQKQIKDAHERITADYARSQAELDADLGRQLQDAEQRIGQAKKSALEQVADVAAEVAQSAVRRLAGIEVSADEARAAVGRAMNGGAPAEAR